MSLGCRALPLGCSSGGGAVIGLIVERAWLEAMLGPLGPRVVMAESYRPALVGQRVALIAGEHYDAAAAARIDRQARLTGSWWRVPPPSRALPGLRASAVFVGVVRGHAPAWTTAVYGSATDASVLEGVIREGLAPALRGWLGTTGYGLVFDDLLELPERLPWAGSRSRELVLLDAASESKVRAAESRQKGKG